MLCLRIRKILTRGSQVVSAADHTWSTLILSSGTSPGCSLSPALLTLFTHGCTAIHSNNTLVMFVDDVTAVGCISDVRPTTERTGWCSDNSLDLNTRKTKEVVSGL